MALGSPPQCCGNVVFHVVRQLALHFAATDRNDFPLAVHAGTFTLLSWNEMPGAREGGAKIFS
jgi:hypothetical protein